MATEKTMQPKFAFGCNEISLYAGYQAGIWVNIPNSGRKAQMKRRTKTPGNWDYKTRHGRR